MKCEHENEKTTIALRKKTVDRLKSLGKKGETYDRIIQQLITKKTKEEREKT